MKLRAHAVIVANVRPWLQVSAVADVAHQMASKGIPLATHVQSLDDWVHAGFDPRRPCPADLVKQREEHLTFSTGRSDGWSWRKGEPVNLSSRAARAPTTDRGTNQTGAEERHGGRLRDRGGCGR